MTPTLLCLYEPTAEVKKRLQAVCRLIGPYADPVADIPAGEAGAVRAILTIGPISVRAPLLDRVPAVGLICAYGAGYEGIDLDELRRRKIALTNAQGGNASCVADLAVTLLLSVALRVAPATQLVKEGKWNGVPVRGWEPSAGFGGKRLGIVGFGEIGRRIAARAAGFELEVAYCTRSVRAGATERYFADVEDMARWADYLVVACSLNESTRHLVDRKVLRALGPAGYLVNIARGLVVDQAAMIEALQQGEIAGAGLDVLEGEPAVPGVLLDMPNVVVTPHIGGMTRRAIEMMTDSLVANLSAHFSGGPLVTPVRLS
jgi:hydroxypyruvate reductase